MNLKYRNLFMMNKLLQQTLPIAFCVLVLASYGPILVAQQLDTASVVRQVDAAVKTRIENLAGYTVTEHYAVFRSGDEVHPIAEMTTITTYQKDAGKSYIIVSQTGSAIVRNLVLATILDNERHLNKPGFREGAWITSANYEMKLKSDRTQPLDGRNCLILSLTPKRKAPYLFEGNLWVDSKDGSIVQLEGTASKSPSLVTGPTHLIRQYADVGGFSEATHARAVSTSSMFGETIVKIDYQDYHIQIRPNQ